RTAIFTSLATADGPGPDQTENLPVNHAGQRARHHGRSWLDLIVPGVTAVTLNLHQVERGYVDGTGARYLRPPGRGRPNIRLRTGRSAARSCFESVGGGWDAAGLWADTPGFGSRLMRRRGRWRCWRGMLVRPGSPSTSPWPW